MRGETRAWAIAFAIVVPCLFITTRLLAADGDLLPQPPVAAEAGIVDDTIWQILFVGLAIVTCLAAVIVWAMSALQTARGTNNRAMAFVNFALNHMTLGIVMVDATKGLTLKPASNSASWRRKIATSFTAISSVNRSRLRNTTRSSGELRLKADVRSADVTGRQ